MESYCPQTLGKAMGFCTIAGTIKMAKTRVFAAKFMKLNHDGFKE